MEKFALVIIDVQNDYFPGGKMELFQSLEASGKIKNVLTYFREKQLEIIHIQHIATKPTATFFMKDTEGVKIHASVTPHEHEKVVIKNYPNSFRNTELEAYLKEKDIKKLIITGMMTHMCIDTTVRAAFDLGYDISVLEDCCATKDLTIHGKTTQAADAQNAFMAALHGTFATVTTSANFLKECAS